MDENYLNDRMAASLEMAGGAAGSAARLIHLELAGRYGLLAAKSPRNAASAPPRPVGPGATSFYGSVPTGTLRPARSV